jgi:ABC-2 type transport system ATP-binding protein
MSTDHKLTLRVDGPEEEVYKLLVKIPEMIRVDKLGLREGKVYEFTLEAEPGADVRREIFKRLAERDWAILGLKSSELSLEDVFLQLTDDNNRQTYGIEKDGTISLDDVVLEGEEIAAAEETTKEDSAQ